MKQIEPAGHRVLVLMDKVEKVSSGGIVLVDSAVEREQTGTESGEVVAVGRDAWYDKPGRWAAPGDMIYFARYAGKQVDGDEYGYPERKLRIINDEDVLGVIREAA